MNPPSPLSPSYLPPELSFLNPWARCNLDKEKVIATLLGAN